MKKRDLLFSILLVAGAFVLYSPSLKSGFVFDDEYVIAGDPGLRSFSHLPGYFLRPSFSFYRPLRAASYHLDYRLWGLAPSGFHLTSILLHGLCGLTFFLLLKILGAGFRLRAGASLIFLLHPIATEPVIYLSSRAELMGTLFALLFLWSGIGFVLAGGWGRALLALVCLAAAFLSKESFLVLPLLFLVLSRLGITANRVSGRRLGLTAGGFILATVFAVFRFRVLQIPAGTDNFARLLDYPQVLIKIPAVLLTYLRLLLVPVGLSPHHPLASAPLPSPPGFAVQLALLAGIFLLLFRVGHRYRRYRMGLLWLAIALLPVSNLYPLNRILAEKYLYFPLLGASWLAAEFLFGTFARGKWSGYLLLAAAAGCWLILTVNRQADWRDNYTLWGKAASQSAPDPTILFNWGMARVRAGEVAGGLEELQRAEAIIPNNPIIREKIADATGMLGRPTEALGIYRELLERFPDSHSLLLKAGFTCAALGDGRRAEEYYRRALERAGVEGSGRELRLHYVFRELAALRQARGELGRAAELLEKTLALFPGDSQSRKRLAQLYRRTGQADRALALEGRPAEEDLIPAGLFARGQQLKRDGRFQEAMQHFHRALKLDPTFAPGYFELGELLAERREYEAAERFFRAGLKLRDDDYRHHTNLGSILQFQGKYREAAAAYQKSLELEESYVARYNLGFLYLNRLRDPQAARTHLEAALKLCEDPVQRNKIESALSRIDSDL